MPEPPVVDFGKLFEGTLEEADLEQIRALVIETKSPEVAAEVVRMQAFYVKKHATLVEICTLIEVEKTRRNV